jgi:hypothetical protein
MAIPDTGSDQTRRTISMGKVTLLPGTYYLKLTAEKSGFGLSFVELQQL